MLVALAAYLLGSIPTGYLVARAKGVDIRTVGSGNIGATNVFRILGKPAGIFVLVMDALKGWAACAYLSLFAYEHVAPNYFVENVRLIVSLKVVAGIVLSIIGVLVYMRRRIRTLSPGAASYSKSVGIIETCGIYWHMVDLLWIVLFALTHYVSLGSIFAAAALPFATWFTTQSILLTVVTSAMSALAIYKHKGNIQRLLAGTESRINFKKEKTAS